MQTFFTPAGNAYTLGVSTTSANITMPGITVTPNTVFKVDNFTGNAVIISFSTSNTAPAVSFPASGSSIDAIPLAAGVTYLNPNLGTYNGNITVTGNARVAGNVFITVGSVSA